MYIYAYPQRQDPIKSKNFLLFESVFFFPVQKSFSKTSTFFISVGLYVTHTTVRLKNNSLLEICGRIF